MMLGCGNGARGRNDAIPANQTESGFQPAVLTDAKPPCPAGDVSNPDPTFTTRAELEAWAKDMAGVVAISVAFAKRGEPEHAASILKSALAQVRRVTLAHLHLKD